MNRGAVEIVESDGLFRAVLHQPLVDDDCVVNATPSLLRVLLADGVRRFHRGVWLTCGHGTLEPVECATVRVRPC